MGARLGISRAKEIFYGTKLFDYAGNNEELKSWQYLEEIGKATPFKRAEDTEVVLFGYQFERFIKLYIEDLTNIDMGYNIESFRKDMQKIIDENKGTDLIVLTWG